MNDAQVKIITPKGEVTLQLAQALEVGHCIGLMTDAGKDPVWHVQPCGCCVVVHDAADHGASGGWLIGSDGGSEWVTP